ncbi:MAG TPA: outer membrane lipoprotein-sorting protein [Polyangia bacterium]|jgi:hypothetical protein
MHHRRLLLVLMLMLLAGGAPALAQPAADHVIKRVLETDAWGFSGAALTARAIVTDARGGTRQLAFAARSRRHSATLSKSLVRFSAPGDIAGVGFLQIQKADGDDDRFLYLPELKRARRIAGNLRAGAFMGTDFSYGDLDQRDLRQSRARLLGEESVGPHACWRLEVTPAGAAAAYARLELWVRKDNNVPLKTLMYNQAGVLLKTLRAQELRRVKGRWFITRSLMLNHQQDRRTELVIDALDVGNDIRDEEFTVRNLERS